MHKSISQCMLFRYWNQIVRKCNEHDGRFRAV
jgi:hypothetical protein